MMKKIFTIASLLLSINQCQSQDIEAVHSYLHLWALANGYVDEAGDIDTFRLYVILVSDGKHDPGEKAVRDAAYVAYDIKKAEEQAKSGLDNYNTELTESAIKLRPNEYRYYSVDTIVRYTKPEYVLNDIDNQIEHAKNKGETSSFVNLTLSMHANRFSNHQFEKIDEVAFEHKGLHRIKAQEEFRKNTVQSWNNLLAKDLNQADDIVYYEQYIRHQYALVQSWQKQASITSSEFDQNQLKIARQQYEKIKNDYKNVLYDYYYDKIEP